MTSMSLTKQTAVSGFSHISSMSSLFLLQVIIARLFGPEGRGIFASIFAITGFLVLIFGTGHSLSNAYLVASGKQTPSEASGSSILGVMVSLLFVTVAVICIIYFRPAFAVFASNRLLLLGLLSIPFHLMAIFSSGILRGLGKAGHSYWYYGIFKSTWLFAVVFFCFLLSAKNMEIVFISKAIAEFVAFGFMLYFLRSHLDYSWLMPNFNKFRESLTYRIRFYFTLIANPKVIHIEIIIIPIFLMDEAALGLYAQAIGIISQIMVVSHVVGYVLMPQVAGAVKNIAQLTAQACRLVLATTVVLGLLIILASKYFVPLVFGKDFSPIIPLMWIMFPGVILLSVSKVLYHYLQGINKPMTVSLVFFASLVGMVTVDILLLPRIGITGAAIGTLVAALLETTLFSVVFVRKNKIKWQNLFILNSSDWHYISRKYTNRIRKKHDYMKL